MLKNIPWRVTFIVLFLILGGFVLVPYSRLNDKVVMADLGQKQRGFGAIIATEEYMQVEKEWPILKLNLDFQKKKTQAQELMKKYKEQRPAVVVFFKEGVTQEEIAQLTDQIHLEHGVTNIKYISKEEALKIYKEAHKNDPALLEMVTADILPASLDIYLSDWNQAKQIQSNVKSLPFVWEVTVSH